VAGRHLDDQASDLAALQRLDVNRDRVVVGGALVAGKEELEEVG
jgi:hypothetical protein